MSDLHALLAAASSPDVDWSRRSPIVDAERKTWWWLRRRFGVPLPAERDLIVIEGGRT